MLCLVINLDRDSARWESVKKQFLALEIEVQRIAAVDAQKDPIPWNRIVPVGVFEKIYHPKELSAQEICCYLSHINCWEKLLNSEEQWAAIFEDDIFLSKRAKEYLLSPNWIPAGIHILQLHTSEKQWHRRTLPRGIPVMSDVQIFRIIKPSVGCQGYLIDRKAAKTAVELSKRLVAPVDEFLFNFKSPFTATYPTRGLNPACVLHNGSFPSNIEDSRKDKKRFLPLKHRLHPVRLFLSTKEFFYKKILAIDTIFTWE